MEQITWTAPDHLVDLARSQARHRGLTLNDYLTEAVDRAARRDLSEETERLRRRLEATRLLASPTSRQRRPHQAEGLVGANSRD